MYAVTEVGLWPLSGHGHLAGGLHRGEAQVRRVCAAHSGALPEEALPQGAVPHRGAVGRLDVTSPLAAGLGQRPAACYSRMSDTVASMAT